MAQHKVSGNDVLLFIGTDGNTYNTVVCLTSNAITRARAIIEANTKCGPDSLPGTPSNTLSFEGQNMYDPNAGTVSVDDLDDYWRNNVTIYWRMGKANPAVGDITYSGSGFISQLDETYAQDAASTFSGAIGIYGTIAKSTATS
jgi:hypothetical protein